MQTSTLLKQINNIPPIPMVISRIMSMIEQDNADAQALAQVIECDAGLSSRVLRVANSAFFGLSSRVEHVQQAIVVLGISEIKNLAFSMTLHQHLEDIPVWSIIDSKEFWCHSLAVALAGKMLSKKSRIPAIDIFTIGILHELGKCALACCFPTQYMKSLDDKTRTSSSSESFYCGVNQAEAGKFLCQHWRLPKQIADTIGQQHIIQENTETVLSPDLLLFYANNLAVQAGFTEIGNNIPSSNVKFPPTMWSPDIIETTLEELPKAVADIENLFCLPLAPKHYHEKS